MHKLIAAIAKALAAIGKAPFTLLDWFLGSGGSGMPATSPEYTPAVPVGELFEELNTRRRNNERQAHRDAVELVDNYLKALPPVRATMDLTGLPVPTRSALLDMSAGELAALRLAGLSAIRKFVLGVDHGVHGVPLVHANGNAPSPATMTLEERLKHKLKVRRMADEGLSEPFRAPKAYR